MDRRTALPGGQPTRHGSLWPRLAESLDVSCPSNPWRAASIRASILGAGHNTVSRFGGGTLEGGQTLDSECSDVSGCAVGCGCGECRGQGAGGWSRAVGR
jgi:hypothetical protein